MKDDHVNTIKLNPDIVSADSDKREKAIKDTLDDMDRRIPQEVINKAKDEMDYLADLLRAREADPSGRYDKDITVSRCRLADFMEETKIIESDYRLDLIVPNYAMRTVENCRNITAFMASCLDLSSGGISEEAECGYILIMSQLHHALDCAMDQMLSRK